ncbi:tetratricopeptide repeat protein [Parahaliea maris]|uniref:Tetratricopeptide repeat protein n=1 Tax=Parahaliea maris TaxID=2716870 RepID=A0A5C8ZYJ9_9GAMM|nr:tetratricopeptide repeat protein [Parahaliea maris]TXS92879.1 tetratricopeptide repeat protein [Parahaliea maris]
MSGLIGELKRRNVFRVAIAYLALGWVIVQVTDVAVPALNLPEWVPSLVFFLGLIGFPVALLFAWAFELTPDGLKRSEDVLPEDSVTSNTGRLLEHLSLGLLAIALGFVVWDAYLSSPSDEAPPAAARISEITESADAPPLQASIAVLPFEDMSPAKDQEYFSDGISEEILNLLAKTEKLRVAARTSSFAFKGTNADVKDIATKLDVGNVLEGSVRKSGNTLRITAQLIDGDSGYHIWSETYDRELKDVFSMQDEISGAILGALKFHLLGEQAHAAADTTNMDAYNAFLIGRSRLNQRTREDVLVAQEKFQEAVRLDPDFAPAHSLLAATWIFLGDQWETDSSDRLSPEEVEREAIPALEKALALNPESADAYAIRGLLHTQRYRFKEAGADLDMAIALNPSHALAYLWRSELRFEERNYLAMLADKEQAYALDPMSLEISEGLARDYRNFWRPEDADRIADRMEQLHPGSLPARRTSIQNLTSLGRYAEALPLLKAATKAYPDNERMRSYYAWSFDFLGLQDEALAFGLPDLSMEVHLVRNEPEAARAILEATTPEDERYNAVLWQGMQLEYWHGDNDSLARVVAAYTQELERRGEPWQERCHFDLIQYYRKLGQGDRTEQMMARCRDETVGMLEAGYLCPCSWFNLVLVAILDGQTDEAVRQAHEWLDKGDSYYGVEIQPIFAELKDHPEFPTLLRRNADQIARQQRIYKAQGKGSDNS